MDSMWSETESSNRIPDITTRPPTTHGKFVSEKLIYCRTELKPNEIPRRFNTLRESSSYGIEIIDQKTHLFQSDFQTRMPLHISENPIGSNIDIQFYEKGTCQGISATKPKIPFMNPNNTFDIPYLDPGEVQKKVQSHVAGIWLDSDNVPQCHRERAPKGTSSHQINDTETFYPDDTLGVISLDPRKPKTRKPSYGAGIQSDLHKTQHSHQESPTKQMDNLRKMSPECIAGATSLDVREAHTRMPLDGVATKSDSASAVQTYFTNGNPSRQIKNPREMYPVNIIGATSLNRRMPSDSPLQEEIPLYQTELEEDEVFTYQADAGNYEEMKASNQTDINSGTTLDQPVNGNVSGTRTCPFCHCVLATQPRPSHIPSLDLEKARHARPSVIMIPLKRKVKST